MYSFFENHVPRRPILSTFLFCCVSQSFHVQTRLSQSWYPTIRCTRCQAGMLLYSIDMTTALAFSTEKCSVSVQCTTSLHSLVTRPVFHLGKRKKQVASSAHARQTDSGVTVITPGGSASHLMLAIPCGSTACRTPGYICPSYSTCKNNPRKEVKPQNSPTSTRSPSRKEDVQARDTCRSPYHSLDLDQAESQLGCSMLRACSASRVGHAATRIPWRQAGLLI